MAKTKEATKDIVAREEVPAHLTQYEGEGATGIERSTEVSRIKTVQDSTADDLKNTFGVGTVILRPDDLVLCERDGTFATVVLHQSRTWAKWYDVNDKSHDLPFEERTTDPDSYIARRAGSRDPGSRLEPYPNGSEMVFKYVEEFNFVVLITESVDVAGSIAFLTLSRGGHRVGRALRDRLKRFSEASGVPVYAHKLAWSLERRKNKADKAWWQLVWQPAGFVAADDIAAMRKMWVDIDAAFAAGSMRPVEDRETVDGDDADDDLK